MIICSILTTRIFTLPKIIWHMLIAHRTCPNSLSYSLNVELISSCCILVSIQLAVHFTKSRPVKCHFHPLCSWWGAEDGAALGKARSGQCLRASHCFSQREGTSVWLGGRFASPVPFCAVAWPYLIWPWMLLGELGSLSKLAWHVWERREVHVAGFLAAPHTSHPLAVWGKLLPLGLPMWIPEEEEQIRLVSPLQTPDGERVKVFQALACGVQAIFQLGVAGV